MKTRRPQITKIGRLLKRADFLHVQKIGKKWVTPTCIIQITFTTIPQQNITSIKESYICRYGLTITKRIWKHSVDRNRVRRRIRALFLGILADHIVMDKIPIGTDFVLLPRTPALNAPIDVIEKDLKWGIKRLIEVKIES